MTIGTSDNFDSKLPWPRGAIEDREHGASYGWIAQKYDRSYSAVAKLLRHYKPLLGADRVDAINGNTRRRGGTKKFADQAPLSAIHQAIGVKLNRYREFEQCINYEQLGQKLGTNRLTARKMELGIHDYTITDLMKLTKLLDQPIEDLMRITTATR